MLNDGINIKYDVNDLINEADISNAYSMFYDVQAFRQIFALHTLTVHVLITDHPTMLSNSV